MAAPVAKKYGVELRRTLTGFKFIGEQIGKLEAEGRPERYIFGFEESYGYLSGGHVRDKDAVNATLLVCEAAAWYAQQGKTLLDAIERCTGSSVTTAMRCAALPLRARAACTRCRS